jgi:hypothetical protein
MQEASLVEVRVFEEESTDAFEAVHGLWKNDSITGEISRIRSDKDAPAHGKRPRSDTRELSTKPNHDRAYSGKHIADRMPMTPSFWLYGFEIYPGLNRMDRTRSLGIPGLHAPVTETESLNDVDVPHLVWKIDKRNPGTGRGNQNIIRSSREHNPGSQ